MLQINKKITGRRVCKSKKAGLDYRVLDEFLYSLSGYQLYGRYNVDSECMDLICLQKRAKSFEESYVVYLAHRHGGPGCHFKGYFLEKFKQQLFPMP